MAETTTIFSAIIVILAFFILFVVLPLRLLHLGRFPQFKGEKQSDDTQATNDVVCWPLNDGANDEIQRSHESGECRARHRVYPTIHHAHSSYAHGEDATKEREQHCDSRQTTDKGKEGNKHFEVGLTEPCRGTCDGILHYETWITENQHEACEHDAPEEPNHENNLLMERLHSFTVFLVHLCQTVKGEPPCYFTVREMT